MIRYRDYMEKERARQQAQARQFPTEEETISREEIFDTLLELAAEEGRVYKIPYDTRDGRRQVLTIDQDGCAVDNGQSGGIRRLPRSAGLRIVRDLTDAEIQPITGGTIADRQEWNYLCRSLDDSAVKLLSKVISAVQADMTEQERMMHYRDEKGDDHTLVIKRAAMTDFRSGDHGVMLTLDGKSVTDKDVLKVIERAGQIEKAELLTGQRQIFLRELRMKATMIAFHFARSAAQSLHRQLSDIAICR